jgi:DNA repair exonuclease SbcCD ATPase subunit
MQTIEVKNTGPVEHVSIPIPENGGVVVLSGRNGIGKSNTLEAVQVAISGSGSLQVRDGALRGEVEGVGVRLTVSKNTRRAGELTVSSIEGRLSIADLVDPGLKTDDAADAKRIRALVAVIGSSATPEAFYGLMGSREEFLDAVSGTALEGDDWLVMADRIKRDLEKTARKIEDKAAHAEGAARGILEKLPEDPQLVPPSDELQERFKQAVLGHSALQERAKQSNEALARKTQAWAAMTETPDEIAARIKEKIDLVAQLNKAVVDSKDARDIAASARSEVKKKLDELQSKLLEWDRYIESIEQQVEVSEERMYNAQSLVATFRESHKAAEHLSLIASMEVETIDPSLLEVAQTQVDDAKQAIERAAVVAKQEEDRTRALQARDEAQLLTKQANDVRSRAKMVDEVLSEQVAKSCKELRVQAGRLVLDTRRGETYFADLSRGERYKLAIDIAIQHIGQNGLIVLPQEAWEGCDANVRKLIQEHAVERGVVIITAQCSTDDVLSAEVL